MYGFEVYTAEVDDRGIDFIVWHANGRFYEVQVKSARRPTSYVFMRKDKFPLCPGRLLALALLKEDEAPGFT